MNNGSFILVLHSHLPYVLNSNRMEEEMLLEAVVETYIPLLDLFNRLESENISSKLTLSFSPVLVEQLAHPTFKAKFEEYCEIKAEFARKDQEEFSSKSAHLHWLAQRWEAFYRDTLNRFRTKYNTDLPGEFARFQNLDRIELITCGATHAYLPALSKDTSINAQIKLAVETYKRHFGKTPRGIWLPECGYRPACHWSPPLTHRKGQPASWRKGIEEFLIENRLEFFIVDFHQILNAEPYDLYKSPLKTYLVGNQSLSFHRSMFSSQYRNTDLVMKTNSGNAVTVFARDILLSSQVWEHDTGYPGDGTYLDFHKRHAEGKHRYWKITGSDVDMQYKDFYYPDDVPPKVQEHAGHYKWLISQSLKANYENTGKAAFIMTAFDTELFGHWWFEGTEWLYYVLKWISADPEIQMSTCSEYLDANPATDWVALPESSWGKDFNSSTWINPEVEWTWERIYHAEHEIEGLAQAFADREGDEILSRILKQVIIELLVLQASDWQFMITNWSTRDLAEKRLVERHEDFKRLSQLAWDYGHGRSISSEDWDVLHKAEERNLIFQDVKIDWFRSTRGK